MLNRYVKVLESDDSFKNKNRKSRITFCGTLPHHYIKKTH